MSDFRSRYGPWAVVTGGSEGVGLSWSQALARRGINVALVPRREAVLERATARLRDRGVEVRTLSADITTPGFIERLVSTTTDIDVGLVIHNVGSWERDHGWFLDDPIEVT